MQARISALLLVVIATAFLWMSHAQIFLRRGGSMFLTLTRGPRVRCARFWSQENDRKQILQSPRCSRIDSFGFVYAAATQPGLRPVLYRCNFRLFQASGSPAGELCRRQARSRETELGPILSGGSLSQSRGQQAQRERGEGDQERLGRSLESRLGIQRRAVDQEME